MTPEKPPSLAASLLGAAFLLIVIAGLVIGAFERLMQ
jgi:hypothetical protein